MGFIPCILLHSHYRCGKRKRYFLVSCKKALNLLAPLVVAHTSSAPNYYCFSSLLKMVLCGTLDSTRPSKDSSNWGVKERQAWNNSYARHTTDKQQDKKTKYKMGQLHPAQLTQFLKPSGKREVCFASLEPSRK